MSSSFKSLYLLLLCISARNVGSIPARVIAN
nr:MAG TPA: hypothetical protein [Caudoviricetes sp.]